jgi:hypothetical protein
MSQTQLEVAEMAIDKPDLEVWLCLFHRYAARDKERRKMLRILWVIMCSLSWSDHF